MWEYACFSSSSAPEAHVFSKMALSCVVNPDFHRDYASIADDHLVRIQRRYGATHALLWSPTATEMPVLYEDQAYTIVRIAVR